MGLEIQTSTMFGIHETMNDYNINPKRARLYWDTFIVQGGLEEAIAFLTDDLNTQSDKDIVEFIKKFTDNERVEEGPFAFINWVINHIPNTQGLDIDCTLDDNDNTVLGIFEINVFPWDVKQYYDDMIENNITKEHIIETLTQHYYLMYQRYPNIEEYDMLYSN